MATLITEAERRLLGAMLNDRTLPIAEVLTADEFSNPAYREVFRAIGYTRANTYLEGPELSAHVAKTADAPGIDQETLELLRTQAPTDRDHLAAYARMVGHAAFMREIRGYSEQLLAEAGPDTDPTETRGLAAVARHTDASLETLDKPIDFDTTAPSRGEAPAHEEQLVASLMDNPEQTRTLVEIVRPEELQDFRCRTAYEYIASTAWHRDPVSDLDLLYQLTRAEQLWINAEIERPTYREPDAAFLQRLRETPTESRTGTEAARAIAAEQVRLRPGRGTTSSVYEHDLAPESTIQANRATPTTQPSPAPQPGIGGGLR